MSAKRSDSGKRHRRIAAFLLSALVMGIPAGSAGRVLFLEDPLRSWAPLGQDRHRLELGSEYFGAHAWTGLRHTLRIDGSRGRFMGWSVAVPWLYSSYHGTGETGRDNLRAGLVGYAPGLARGRLCLGAEVWLPFSEDRLYPLQQRRCFGRATLTSAVPAAGMTWRTALSYCWELRGVGPQTTGGPWPERLAADLRAGKRLGGAWEPFVEGGISVSSDAATWSRLGGGLGLRWSEVWSAEAMAETSLGNQEDPDLYDYRISLRLTREFIPPAPEASEKGTPGETPPPEGPER